MYRIKDIIHIIKNKEAILFLGSGISTFYPTCLPDSKGLIDILISSLPKLPINKKVVDNLRKNIFLRPEVCFMYFHKYLMESLLYLFTLFKDSSPNFCHFFLAELLRRGYCNIITTNYDDALENALEDNNYNVVAKEEDFSKPFGDRLIIKLHGCAKKDEYSCLLDIRDVSFQTSKLKAKIVKELSKDKIVLFIGYSGRDMDIFPILNSLKCSSMIWITLPIEESKEDLLTRTYSKDMRDRLIRKYRGALIEERIENLIKELREALNFRVVAQSKFFFDVNEKKRRVKTYIRKRLNDFNTAMILGEICNHLGLNKEALKFFRFAKSNCSFKDSYIVDVEIAKLLSQTEESDKAIRIFSNVIHSSCNIEKITAHRCLAEIYRIRQNWAEALPNIEQAIKLSEPLKNYSEIGWCVLTQANIFSDRMLKKEDDIIEIYRKARRYSKKGKDLQGYAQGTLDLGSLYYTRCRYNQANRLYQQAGEQFMQIYDKTGLAMALANLAMLKTEFGKLKTAIEYRNEACLLFEELHKKRSVASSLANLAWTYLECGFTDKALDNIKKSFQIARKVDFKGIQHYLLILKTNCYLRRFETKKALELMEKIEETDITQEFVFGQYLFLKTKVYFLFGDFKNTLLCLNRLIKQITSPHAFLLAKAYFLKSQVYISKRKLLKAVYLVHHAIRAAEPYNYYLAYIFVTYFITIMSDYRLCQKHKRQLTALKKKRKKIMEKLSFRKMKWEIEVANNIIKLNLANKMLLI